MDSSSEPARRPAPAQTGSSHNETGYSLSEASSTSPLAALADLAPTLKEGELRLLTALAALTENREDHAIRISIRDLEKLTRLATSALVRAINALKTRNLIAVRRGGTTNRSAYMVNFLTTARIRGASFGEPPPSQGVVLENKQGASQKEAQAQLFEKEALLFEKQPPTENKGEPENRRYLDIDTDENPIDRVLSAKPKNADPEALLVARRWMHSYKAKLGRTQDPHPPDDAITAQFLAVAPWVTLERLLYQLLAERRQPGESYAWFVTVALQRIHGVSPGLISKRRTQLGLVKRQSQPDAQFTQQLLSDAIAGVKKIR